MNSLSSQRLALPQVTLLAVTSVNLDASVAALEASIAEINFGAAKLLTSGDPGPLRPGLEKISIGPLGSARAYSDFVLQDLVDYVTTSHVLLVQWDGHVLHANRWRPEFLDYDYVGASWPQFDDGHDVGNGGFSLRSRALLEACRDPQFRPSHPEDLAICRHNRTWLEARGLRFAPRILADTFSAERAGNPAASFGYHGVWHMPRLLGRERFWRIYLGLDERTSVQHDFRSLLLQVGRGGGGFGRAARLVGDKIRGAIGSRKHVK
jgi:hypothetical protein